MHICVPAVDSDESMETLLKLSPFSLRSEKEVTDVVAIIVTSMVTESVTISTRFE